MSTKLFILKFGITTLISQQHSISCSPQSSIGPPHSLRQHLASCLASIETPPLFQHPQYPLSHSKLLLNGRDKMVRDIQKAEKLCPVQLQDSNYVLSQLF